MMDAGCRDWLTEVVEYARQGTQPSSAVRHHLKLCSHCRARWEDELRLTSELRTLAEAAQLRRPPESRRQQIMAEFDSVQPRRSRPAWKWAAAAAAVLLFGIGVVEMPRLHQVGPLAQDAPVHENADADASDGSDFVDVPYAAPLAAGELVSVVRTQLQPAALARMGISVDLAYGSEIAADVMVGEDGLPRAVRLVEAVDF